MAGLAQSHHLDAVFARGRRRLGLVLGIVGREDFIPEIDNRGWLVNAPSCIAKWRAAAPMFQNKLWAAAAMQYLSPRRTVADSGVPSVWLTDLTLTTRKLHPDFDIQFGVRNLLNRVYYDPAGAGLPEQMLRENGRSIFLKLILRTRE